MAVVRGLQGPEDAGYDKLHACAKHFAVHSGPEWNRHSFDAENIAPRDLWETYLPAFKDLVQKAHVKEVMCAYNRFEGEPCCGSNRLLMQILRDEWGYKGIVVSDCERFPISIDRERMGLIRTRNTLRQLLCGQAQTLNVEVNMLHWRML